MERGTLAIPMRITGNPKLQNQKEVAPAGFSATSSQIMTLRSTATEKRFDHNYSRHYEIISKYVYDDCACVVLSEMCTSVVRRVFVMGT